MPVWGAPKAVPEALVIRADRIESKGLLMGIGKGNHGLVMKMSISEAKISGMEMGALYDTGNGSKWTMSAKDPGPVSIDGLSVSASAVGFKIDWKDFIHFNKPFKLGNLMPSIVLHDVYMRVENMDAALAQMPNLNLEAGKGVSIDPPDDGLLIDLRKFSSLSKGEREKQINKSLSPDKGKDKKDPKKDPKKEPGDKDDSKPDDPAGGDPPDSDNSGDPGNPTDPTNPGTPTPDNPDPLQEKVILHRYFMVAEIVNKAKEYSAKVTLKRGDKEYDAKKWENMILMNRFKGSEVTVTAEGSDAEKAVREIADWFK